VAALRGHIVVLQWAHDNGCPWDEETCGQAAYFGHSDILQWARANGCPWNANAILAALNRFRNYPEISTWIEQNMEPSVVLDDAVSDDDDDESE
jgi:hypothetical protein